MNAFRRKPRGYGAEPRAQALLSKLYNDPITGFQSAQKLYKKAKALDSKITYRIVNDFLKKQESTQINLETKRQSYHHIVAHHVNNGHQMDLIDVSKYKSVNKGYKWILTIVDIYSRRAWAIPIKTKSAADVNGALTDLYKDKKNIPEQVSSDLGTEFLNKQVQATFAKHDIKHWTYEPGSHNTLGIIERFNRTLRTMLRKYWAAFDTRQYVEALPHLIENYNSSYHRTIDAQPIMVFEGKADPKRHESPKIQNFKVGDVVRKKTTLNIFDKPTERWSKEIYEVVEFSGRKYILKNVKSDEPLKGKVKPQDMQLIPKGQPGRPSKPIGDAHVAKAAIKKQNIEKLHKQLGNDTSKILPEGAKRVRKANSKFKDFV